MENPLKQYQLGWATRRLGLEEHPHGYLEGLRPLAGTVVNGEDDDSGLVDGIGGEKRGLGNDQFTGSGHAARPAQQGEGSQLFDGRDDLGGNPGGDRLGIGKQYVVVSLMQLPGGLLGPDDR